MKPEIGADFLQAPFDMRIAFRSDDTGCACTCGEYHQTVKGLVTRDHGTGGETWTVDEVQLVGGLMKAHTAREDARAHNPLLPYGHRFLDDVTRTIPRVNLVGDRFGNGAGLGFVRDRANGCVYEGADAPGTRSDVRGST